jgi:molybdopterin/thiamine biosynthesis adenylyltransferase
MNSLLDLHSRETLAGYDRARLERAVVMTVGAGAAGNNIVQTLALGGVGEQRVIDPDTIEPSNLTRSPLFRRERLAGNRRRHKARELAVGALAHSYAASPVARYAVARIESLGLGVFEGVDVVISAVDSLAVRAYLADATRLLGVPFVEVGFAAAHGHLSVFPNRSGEEACWRCLHPQVASGGFSCALYAAEAEAQGRIPATQTIAAVFGALAAEAAIQALHGEFPLGGQVLELNIRTGATLSYAISPDPACPGFHRRYPKPTLLEVGADEPLRAIFAALGPRMVEPVLHLPMPYLVAAPCTRCGALVSVGRPIESGLDRVLCKACPTVPQLGPGGLQVLTQVRATDSIRDRACRKAGLPPGAIFQVEDVGRRTMEVVRLRGTPGDLLLTVGPRDRAGADRSDDDPPPAPSTEA